MKKNFKLNKHFIILFLLLGTFVTISASSYAKSVSSDLSSNVFRLHVIANSDSKEDQDLKYKVRDALISYMDNLCANLSNKEDVINISKEHINDFEQIALNVIRENGYNYEINVEIGNFEFPTKMYGDISLPAGYYDALRVKIGNATRSKLVVCNVSSFMFCRYNVWCCS